MSSRLSRDHTASRPMGLIINEFGIRCTQPRHPRRFSPRFCETSMMRRGTMESRHVNASLLIQGQVPRASTWPPIRPLRRSPRGAEGLGLQLWTLASKPTAMIALLSPWTAWMCGGLDVCQRAFSRCHDDATKTPRPYHGVVCYSTCLTTTRRKGVFYKSSVSIPSPFDLFCAGHL